MIGLTYFITFASVGVAWLLVAFNNPLVRFVPVRGLREGLSLVILPYAIGILGHIVGIKAVEIEAIAFWGVFCLLVSVCGYVGIFREVQES